MKNFIINLIKALLCLITLTYAEEYLYKLLDTINFKLNYPNLVSLIIYIIIFIFVYFIYRKEIKSAFEKYKNKWAVNILYTLVLIIVLFISMVLFDKLIKVLADAFSIKYHSLTFMSIFNKKITFKLICNIIKYGIITPFVKGIIFILGINNMIESKKSIVVSGLLYGIYSIYVLYGLDNSMLFILFNMLPYTIMVCILSFIYLKQSNIAFSILIWIMYELSAEILSRSV